MRVIFHSISRGNSDDVTHVHQSSKVSSSAFRPLLWASQKKSWPTYPLLQLPPPPGLCRYHPFHSYNLRATCSAQKSTAFRAIFVEWEMNGPEEVPQGLLWVHFVRRWPCGLKLQLPVEAVISMMQPTFPLLTPTPSHNSCFLGYIWKKTTYKQILCPALL